MDLISGASLRLLFLSLVLVQIPVQTRSSTMTYKQTENKSPPRSADVALHYNTYLQQVVQYLEKDPHFREKLRTVNATDIQDGSLSQELDFVHHSIRTKLDELKREEITRLRMLLKAKRDLRLKKGKGQFRDHQALLKHFNHMDFTNPHGFEVEDLDRLIKAATKDLQTVDEQQHEAFKRYEMMKEHERRERLKNLTTEEKEREEKQYQEQREKHSKHPKLNHPGSEDQLKEVWHETDGLDEADFNPKTFFKLHDTNQDGYLDEDELEALFTRELAKAYDPENEEDDMMEMEEERLRMREVVMTEVDTDGDKIISEQEFMEHTKRQEFHKNDEWETVDREPFFTDAEMREFEEHLVKQMEQHETDSEQLERQKNELEEKQKQLDAQKQQLEQAWSQLDKLKDKREPWGEHHEEEAVHKSSPEPHQS